MATAYLTLERFRLSELTSLTSRTMRAGNEFKAPSADTEAFQEFHPRTFFRFSMTTTLDGWMER